MRINSIPREAQVSVLTGSKGDFPRVYACVNEGEASCPQEIA